MVTKIFDLLYNSSYLVNLILYFGNFLFLFFKFLFFNFYIFLRFYLFLDRGEGREKERERNMNVWLPLVCPLLGTWPATQARVLTSNRTGDPLVCSPALSPLSHTSQGLIFYLLMFREKERDI